MRTVGVAPVVPSSAVRELTHIAEVLVALPKKERGEGSYYGTTHSWGCIRTALPQKERGWGTAYYGTTYQWHCTLWHCCTSSSGGIPPYGMSGRWQCNVPLGWLPLPMPSPPPPPAPHRSQHLFDSIPRYLMFYPFQRLLAVSHTEGQPFVEGEMWWQAWPW